MFRKLFSMSLLAVSLASASFASPAADPVATALNLRETYVTVGDAKIHVVDGGKVGAPAIVFLHGFPDSWKLWRKQIPAVIAAGYRAVALDLRGFGLSSRPADLAQYKLAVSVQDTLAVMDALSIQKASIVGHDFGGFIAWMLAASSPARVNKLVAMTVGHPSASTKIDFDIADLKNLWYHFFFQKVGIAEFLMSNNSFKLFRQWVKNHSETENWIADFSRPADDTNVPGLTGAFNIFRANSDEIFTVLPQITPPVTVPALGLLSKGDLDYVREEVMTKSAEFCQAGFTYKRLSAPSHWSMLDRPQEVSRAIIDFVKR